MARRRAPEVVATCPCGAVFRAAATRDAPAAVDRVNAQLAKHYKTCAAGSGGSGRKR